MNSSAAPLDDGPDGTPESPYFTMAEMPIGTYRRFVASKDLGVTWHPFSVWSRWERGALPLCRFRGFVARERT